MSNLKAAVKARKERIPIEANTEDFKRKRPPIADRRMRMWFPKDPKFYRVWVNDVKGFVQDYLDSGFDFVTWDQIGGRQRVGQHHIEDGGEMESRVTLQVGRCEHEENATAYLMQIPMKDWEEIRDIIREDKMRPLKDIEREVSNLKNSQGFYGGLKHDAT